MNESCILPETENRHFGMQALTSRFGQLHLLWKLLIERESLMKIVQKTCLVSYQCQGGFVKSNQAG